MCGPSVGRTLGYIQRYSLRHSVLPCPPRAPLYIPGKRHQGARVFHLEFGAPLRYQNPDALITFRATKEPFSNMVVELASGEEHTLDVAGMQSSEILERVLDVSGMPAAERATTMHIVTTQLKPNAAQHASATRPPRATERDGSAAGPERGLCGVGGPERLWGQAQEVEVHNS